MVWQPTGRTGEALPQHREAAAPDDSGEPAARTWGNRSRRRPTRGGARFRGWRGEKLTVERAPRRWVGGRRETAWRASSGGGGAWLMARREVRSTGGARGGVGGAVPWPEVPVYVEELLGGNDGAGWLAVGSE
jgi:hypothetical protein